MHTSLSLTATITFIFCSFCTFTRSDTTTVSSISSCEKFATCSQRCTTINGSAHCSCLEGFHLEKNGKSCSANDNTWKLLYTTKSDIKFIKRNESGSEQVQQICEVESRPLFVTFDVENNIAFWTGISANKEAVYKAYLNENDRIEVIVDAGLDNPEGVAFDWITGNLYFVEESKIIACRHNSLPLACVDVIDEKLDKPRGIALHANQGLMFWTEWGDIPSIKRAEMDGKLPQTIISTDIGWPNGITVDEGNSRIYWVDARMDRIESSLFDGTDRQVIITQETEHPFGVDLFEDRIFWSDWHSFAIKSANKFTGKDVQVHLQNFRTMPMPSGVALMHRTKQQKLRPNPCETFKCSHVCVLSSVKSLTGCQCLCPSGMVLDSQNGKTCVEDELAPKLLLTFENKLALANFNRTGKNVFEKIHHLPPEMDTINAVVYFPRNQSILMSVVTDFSNNFTLIIEYNLKTEEFITLLDDMNVNITAMDIDVVSENLYWIDSGRKTVEAMSLGSGARTVLLTDVENLLDIIFVAESSSIFLAKVGSIHKMFVGGHENYNDTLFLDVINESPTALSYDREDQTILWSCAGCTPGPITSVSATFERVHPHDNPIVHQFLATGQLIMDMFKYQNEVYAVDSSPNIKIISARGVRPYNTGDIFNSTLQSVEKRILVINANTSYLDNLFNFHECSPKNSKRKACSHICLPTGKNLVGECGCPVDQLLGKDGLTCMGQSQYEKLECSEENSHNCQTNQKSGNNDIQLSAGENSANIQQQQQQEYKERNSSNASAMTITVISFIIVIVTICLGVIIIALVMHWRRNQPTLLPTKPFYVRVR